MNLNAKQWLAISIAVLGAVSLATAQLTDIFGAGIAKAIVSLASVVQSVISSVLAVISSQSQNVLDVQGMTGVDKIVVNEKANSTLASLAIDPANAKIQASPGASAAVHETARNG